MKKTHISDSPIMAANTITAKLPSVFVQYVVLYRVSDLVPERVLQGVPD
jgi:hypothetical protein